MRNLIVLLILGFGFSAQAAAAKFSCANVGGTAEWTIYVDLEKKLAGFFDNDTTVTVPLVEITSLESFPPQTEYIFKGSDTAGAESDTLQINFNLTKKSAFVTFDDGKEKTTQKSLDGCVVDNNIDL